jgi:hypothetical protein
MRIPWDYTTLNANFITKKYTITYYDVKFNIEHI